MTQEQFLKDTIDYYSANPSERRCVGSTGCFYSPKNAENPTSDGCAIGRWLKPKVQKLFDSRDNSAIGGLIEENPEYKKLLPKWMQKMSPAFLRSVQNLHDENDHWDNTGLTVDGIYRVNRIIEIYSLDMPLLKKFPD